MTNDKMIDQLINCDIQYIMQTENGLELLKDYLHFGFQGYENFTAKQLIAEIEQRKEMGQL